MPLEHYPQAGFEVLDNRLRLWRFMKMQTFTRFIESGSLYFCRADLLGDEHEGLPIEEYVRGAVATLGPEMTFEYAWETLKQDRQGSFVSCWTLDETLHMWEKFAPEGVAAKSDVTRLKAVLNSIPERAMLGCVRYSLQYEGYNILRFITTKRPEFHRETEVRALVWDLTRCPQNPYPHDMPNGLSYPVDVLELVQTVIVAPYAPPSIHDEVRELLKKCGYGSIAVVKSGFTGFGRLLPTAAEVAKYSSK
jgi:hypothetical protein